MNKNISDNNLPRYAKGRIIALAGAIILHTGIAAWAIQPEASLEVKQQVIKISMVAPSSFAQPKRLAQAEVAPVTPPKQNGLKHKKQAEKKLEQKIEEKEKKSASTPLTSGPQAPDATEKVAARTDPVFNAAYLHNPVPAYPDSARRKGAQGKVLLQVAVTREGSAREVEIARSSGFDALDEAARSAVKNWQFIPAKRGDEIIEAKVLVPVEFKLN